jgi:hypothetical protein
MEEEENQNLTGITTASNIADWVMTEPEYAQCSLRIDPQVYVRDTTSEMQDRIKELEIQVKKLTALVMGTSLETFGEDDMMDI